MEAIEKDLIIQEFPLFADLAEKERKIIKERSSVISFKKGDIIYQEGALPSGFYCLAIGRVVIYVKDNQGNQKILEHLHRGKYFGIISLLTNEPHSVTAQAINDCVILTISKEDFDLVINKIPRLAIDLSRTLSRRLRRKDTLKKAIFESTVVSVFSSYSQAGKTIYSLNLALSLKKETRKSVIILDILSTDKMHSLPSRLGLGAGNVFDLSQGLADNSKLAQASILKSGFGIDLLCFHYRPEDNLCVRRLLGILSGLVNDYHFIILDLPNIRFLMLISLVTVSAKVTSKILY